MAAWTEKEVDLLKKFKEQGLTNKEISTKLKRSWQSVRAKWIKLNKGSAAKVGEAPPQIEAEKFIKIVYEIADGVADKIKAPPVESLFKGKLEESAVLMLSDVHVGKVNYFLDMDTGESIETYNRRIMLEEFNSLLDGIGTINALLSNSYNIKKLYIFGLGDLVDNNMIVKGQEWFVDAGVGIQVILAANCFKQMILELLKYFEEIEMIVVPGNHGRMTKQWEKAPLGNNFDWVLGQILKRDFKNERRVNIITSDMWFYRKTIYKWNYLLHHGNTLTGWMGFPYYSTHRKGTSRRVEVNINMECIGHFHQCEKIPISSRSYTLINGCWIDRDNYTWEKYGVFSIPKQIYFGVSPKRPCSWYWELDLDKKGEQVVNGDDV